MTNTEKVKSVKLFNKSGRVIFGSHPDVTDESGQPKKYIFRPQKALSFHPSEAAKLVRLYGKQEIVSLDDVQSQFDASDAAPVKSVDLTGFVSKEEAEQDKQDAIAAALADYKASLAASTGEDTEDAESEKSAADEEGEKKDSEDDEDEFAKKNTIAKAAGRSKKK